MIFKRVINVHYMWSINTNNIQNNQRKDNLIVHIDFKCNMFTKGNGILKKSGEIFSNVSIKTTGNDINNITVSTANNLKFRLDASNNKVKAQNLAYFTKILKNKIPYQNVRIYYGMPKSEETYHDEIIATYKLEMNEGLELKAVTPEQYLALQKRFRMLNTFYVHFMVIDKISEDGENITYIQHAVTTKDLEVNAGGPNKFYPIYLCQDKVYNIPLYVIPLTYVNKVKKEKFFEIFNFKKNINVKDEVLNNLQIETEKAIIENLINVMTLKKFKELHIQDDILNKSVYGIVPTEEFKDKSEIYEVAPWEPLPSIDNN